MSVIIHNNNNNNNKLVLLFINIITAAERAHHQIDNTNAADAHNTSKKRNALQIQFFGCVVSICSICCQTDEDVFLICRCFFYLHVFSEVEAHWARSATIHNNCYYHLVNIHYYIVVVVNNNTITTTTTTNNNNNNNCCCCCCSKLCSHIKNHSKPGTLIQISY